MLNIAFNSSSAYFKFFCNLGYLGILICTKELMYMIYTGIMRTIESMGARVVTRYHRQHLPVS